MAETKKKAKRTKTTELHKFMVKLPKEWHEKMVELQHKKRLPHVQKMYHCAIEEILKANKMI